MQPTDTSSLELRIQATQKELEDARKRGNTLRVELLENALNDLLDTWLASNGSNT